jgi:hypothetical protein
MAHGSDDEDEGDLSKQVMNILLQNNALKGTLTGYLAFNVVILLLLIYISVRISLK